MPTSNPNVTRTPSRTAIPTGTPTGTPGPTPSVTCVCRKLYRRVPPVVIADAVANPPRFHGWGLPLNPNKPIGPDNPVRTCLSLRSMSNPYHPT